MHLILIVLRFRSHFLFSISSSLLFALLLHFSSHLPPLLRGLLGLFFIVIFVLHPMKTIAVFVMIIFGLIVSIKIERSD